MTRLRLVVLVVVLGLLAGALVVGRDRRAAARASSVSLAQLSSLRLAVALAPCPAGLGPALPATSLRCLGGGPDVALRRPVGRPAVVNLWAWWCAPCQRETPLLVDLATRSAGRLDVVGVASDPDERLTLEYAKDFQVHYPMLFDPGRLLERRYGNGLPVTLFLDASGAVRGERRGEITDRGALDALVAEHLGLTL